MSVAVDTRKATTQVPSSSPATTEPVSPKFPPRAHFINFGGDPELFGDKQADKDKASSKLTPAISAARNTLNNIGDGLDISRQVAWQTDVTKQVVTTYGIHTGPKTIDLAALLDARKQWQNVAQENLRVKLSNASTEGDILYWTGATFRLAEILIANRPDHSSKINYISTSELKELEPETLVSTARSVSKMLEKIKDSGSEADKMGATGIVSLYNGILKKITGVDPNPDSTDATKKLNTATAEELDTAAAKLTPEERATLITCYARCRVVTKTVPGQEASASTAPEQRETTDVSGYKGGISLTLPKGMTAEEITKIRKSVDEACASIREITKDGFVEAVAKMPIEIRLGATPEEPSGVRVLYKTPAGNEIDYQSIVGRFERVASDNKISGYVLVFTEEAIRNPYKVSYHLAQRVGMTLAPPDFVIGSRVLKAAKEVIINSSPELENPGTAVVKGYEDRIAGYSFICLTGNESLAVKVRGRENATRGTDQFTPELANEVSGMNKWAVAYANVVVKGMSPTDFLMGRKPEIITDPQKAWEVIEKSQRWADAKRVAGNQTQK